MEEKKFYLKFISTSDPEYIKEQEERKKDTSWHKGHDFVKSFFFG